MTVTYNPQIAEWREYVSDAEANGLDALDFDTWKEQDDAESLSLSTR